MKFLSLDSLMLFFQNNIFTTNCLFQLVALGTGFILAYVISCFLKKLPENRFLNAISSDRLRAIASVATFPLCWSLIQWTIVAVSRELDWHSGLSYAAAEFITAWLVIRCISLVIIQPRFKKLIIFSIYSITTLDVFGLLSHLPVITDNFALNIGELHISFFSILKGGSILFILIWGTTVLSRRIERKLKGVEKIEPSLQELFAKLVKVSLIAFSILIALSTAGLNLSAFAVFGGAIAVGIGFGLQKIVSNLICGIILLLDRSIKLGDVIALKDGKSYGVINRLGARCVIVRTRSGKEHLIPNEEFIIHRSENWSLTDSFIRLNLPMRAGLESDVNLVMKLLVEATEGVERIASDRVPAARLCAFSESAIEFDLRVWIKDPRNGISKVKSDIYINIWSLFKKNGIRIPYPHRNLHISGIPNDISPTATDSLEDLTSLGKQ